VTGAGAKLTAEAAPPGVTIPWRPLAVGGGGAVRQPGTGGAGRGGGATDRSARQDDDDAFVIMRHPAD